MGGGERGMGQQLKSRGKEQRLNMEKITLLLHFPAFPPAASCSVHIS